MEPGAIEHEVIAEEGVFRPDLVGLVLLGGKDAGGDGERKRLGGGIEAGAVVEVDGAVGIGFEDEGGAVGGLANDLLNRRDGRGEHGALDGGGRARRG